MPVWGSLRSLQALGSWDPGVSHGRQPPQGSELAVLAVVVQHVLISTVFATVTACLCLAGSASGFTVTVVQSMAMIYVKHLFLGVVRNRLMIRLTVSASGCNVTGVQCTPNFCIKQLRLGVVQWTCDSDGSLDIAGDRG